MRTVLLVCLVAAYSPFSGCTTPGLEGGPSIWQAEYAAYEWHVPERGSGSLRLNMQWSNGSLAGVASVDGELDGTSVDATLEFSLNASSGERRWLRFLRGGSAEPGFLDASLPDILYPFGSRALVGDVRLPAPQAPQSLLEQMIPLGPQWAVVAGATTWGAFDIHASRNGETWRLAAGGACDSACLHAVNGERLTEITVVMSGHGPGMFPITMERRWSQADVSLVLTRAEHDAAGQMVPTNAEPPPGLREPHGPQCPSPCEPRGWPARLSLRRALAAMEAEPRWLGWAAEHPDWSLRRVFGAPQDMEASSWLVRTGAPASSDFALAYVGLAAGGPLLALEAAESEPWAGDLTNAETSPLLPPVNATLGPVLRAFNASHDDIAVLGFVAGAPDVDANLLGRYRWVVHMRSGHEPARFEASAYHARLLEVTLER